MSHHLLLVLERLAGNGQPFFQDASRFREGQGISLDGRGGVGPQVPELGYQGFLEVEVEVG